MRSESRFPGCARTEKPGKQTTTLSATRPGRGEETSAYLVKEGVVALAESTTHRILATHAHAISVAQGTTHEKALDVTRKDAGRWRSRALLTLLSAKNQIQGPLRWANQPLHLVGDTASRAGLNTHTATMQRAALRTFQQLHAGFCPFFKANMARETLWDANAFAANGF